MGIRLRCLDLDGGESRAMTNMLAEMAPSQNPRLRRTTQVSRKAELRARMPILIVWDGTGPGGGMVIKKGRHTCQGFGGRRSVRRVAEANRGKHIVGGRRQRRMRMQGRVRIVILAVVPFAIHDVGVDWQRKVVKSRRTQTRRFGGEGRRSRGLQGIKLWHLHPSVMFGTCGARGCVVILLDGAVCRVVLL